MIAFFVYAFIGFVAWLFLGNPFKGDGQSGALEVKIAKNTINLSRIPVYNPPIGKKFNYKPQTLNEYIGQQKAKEIVRDNIKKIKQWYYKDQIFAPVHFLIHSIKGGTGKTTISNIIANELDANFIYRSAGDINDPKAVEEILFQIASSEKLTVLCLDEIHRAKFSILEQYFYTLMTNFKIQEMDIKPFILIACTTNKSDLQKSIAPFVTRFQVDIQLERYTIDDIVTICKQYKNQLFPDVNIPEDVYKIIAKNSRHTPRLALSLVGDYVIRPDINKIVANKRIVKDGITDIEVSILNILKEQNRPMGAKAISGMIGIAKEDYEILYESFLVEQNYIAPSSRGRILTQKGLDFLKGV